MKRVCDASRVLLGLILVLFGLNGFHQFITPPEMAPRAMAFIHSLIETQYMVPFWKGTEIVCGALFLLNWFVPLASVAILPVLLNIFAFHLFLDLRNLPIGVVLLGLNGLVMLSQYSKLRSVLTP